MTAVPTPTQLAKLDDAELDSLAVAWRAQAARGDRTSFGIAHALEVEHRRRLRDSQMAQLLPEPQAPLRRWWQFWREPDNGRKRASHVSSRV